MDSSPTENINESGEITAYMDSKLYKAAENGEINTDAFKNNKERLHLLVTPNKNTVLHIYITARSNDKVEFIDILEKMLEICPKLLLQKNAKGETPLHMAARYGRSRTVAFLIERAKALHEDNLEAGGVGVAVQMLRITNNDEDTALHEAVRFNYLGVVQLLTEVDPEFSYSANLAGETPLYLAAERGFGDMVYLILDQCTSPAHDGPCGRTALHAAVICNHKGITKYILAKKGGLTKIADEFGWTPLHYAAFWDYVPLVDLLLNCDLSTAYIQDKHGKTALHIAADRGNFRTMKKFLVHCPDCFELVDEEGQNVLHMAAKNNNYSAVKLVLQNSTLANLFNDKDNKGNTPLHQLVASGTITLQTINNKRSTFYRLMAILLRNPTVDKKALNKDNLSAFDTMISMQTIHDKLPWSLKKIILKELEKGGVSISQRRSFEELMEIESHINDLEIKKENDRSERLMKAKDAHLVVATLIATVTFAAGFTLPGGYIGDKGSDMGAAILMRETSFRAFVISDTVAMVMSSSAMFVHLFLAMYSIHRKGFDIGFRLAFVLTIFAMGAMVVAFMTGLYAVLQHSLGLAITTLVIVCCCFLFQFLYLNKIFFSPTEKRLRKSNRK